MEIINLDKLVSDSISIKVMGPDGRITEVYDKEKGVYRMKVWSMSFTLLSKRSHI